jgi:ribosomal protein S18 acetylase RimI-like enzyme
MVMWVKPFSALSRKLFRSCFARVQRTSLYRVASGHSRRGVEIMEAADVDLDKVCTTFDLQVKASPPGDRDVVNFVAKKGENIVGFAQLVKHSEGDTIDNGYYLFSLNVRLLYRGLAIGRDLTKKVMARAKAEGALELSVITNEDNWTALGLFHKLGFRTRRIGQKPSWQGRKKVILVRTLVD